MRKQTEPSLLDRCVHFCILYQDRLVKIAVIAVLIGFMGYRITLFRQFPGLWSSVLKLFRFQAFLSGQEWWTLSRIRWFWIIRLSVWILESLNIFAYIISYWTRIPPAKRSEGIMEILFPLAVSGIPMIIVLFKSPLSSLALTDARYLYMYLFILILMGLGSMITLSGVWHLRQSFSLRIEVRALVQSGPYRWIRHPIYLGYFITFLGSFLLHFSAFTGLLYFMFVTGQIARARLEEDKLTAAVPEYAAYRKQTGMFLPKL